MPRGQKRKPPDRIAERKGWKSAGKSLGQEASNWGTLTKEGQGFQLQETRMDTAKYSAFIRSHLPRKQPAGELRSLNYFQAHDPFKNTELNSVLSYSHSTPTGFSRSHRENRLWSRRASFCLCLLFFTRNDSLPATAGHGKPPSGSPGSRRAQGRILHSKDISVTQLNKTHVYLTIQAEEREKNTLLKMAVSLSWNCLKL